MAEIQGIHKIRLIENKNITFRYVNNEVTNLATQGKIILFDNHNKANLKYDTSVSINSGLLFDYNLSFVITGLSNILQIGDIVKSVYGWAFILELYSGDKYFINTAMSPRVIPIDIQKEHTYKVVLQTAVPTIESLQAYNPNPVYTVEATFDSTSITFDNTFITFDQT